MTAVLTWLWLLARLLGAWCVLSFATTVVYVVLRKRGYFQFEARQ